MQIDECRRVEVTRATVRSITVGMDTDEGAEINVLRPIMTGAARAVVEGGYKDLGADL